MTKRSESLKAHYKFHVCGWVHGNLWRFVSLLIYTHAVYACVCVCVCVRASMCDVVWCGVVWCGVVWCGVCVCVCAGNCECKGVMFQCVSISLCFVWLSMCSNVLLCYWFLHKYLCIPCFCLIKWQSVLSHQKHTINSILLLLISVN